MDLSCAFATSLDTPEHIRIAESIGYDRAWAYDSPALYPDVWAVLSLAATRTTSIGIGARRACAEPSASDDQRRRHRGLCALAPDRVAVAIGSGFMGRYTLGQKPLRWTDVGTYVRVLRGLLAGETVEWEGAPIRMLHPPGFASPRPVEVPILVGADGPKGTHVAQAVGDGIFAAGLPNRAATGWHAVLQFGTCVLLPQRPDQSANSTAEHRAALRLQPDISRGAHTRSTAAVGNSNADSAASSGR